MATGERGPCIAPGRGDGAFLVAEPPFLGFAAVEGVPESLPEGAALLVPLDDIVNGGPGLALERVLATVRQIRRRFPGVVLGGVVGREHPAGLGGTAQLLRDGGVRFHLAGEAIGDALRTALGRAGVSSEDVAVWLRERLRPVGLIEQGVVRGIASVLGGARIDGTSGQDLRRWLPRLNLPPLQAWKGVARLLKPVVELQADPLTRIADVALRHGFADAASFTHSCHLRFGCPPSEARQRLGWEGLLLRFMEESGRRRDRQAG